MKHQQLTPDVAAAQAKVRLWRDTELQASPVDAQLALLPRVGAAWRPLAALIDSESVRASVTALGPSQVLAGVARTITTPLGAFTVKTSCALCGAHAYRGRVLRHPRTVEVREHVQVRGPGSRLDAAIGAFSEHICASALAVHACKEHFVHELEVFTGEGDAFDDEATAEVNDARATSNARGPPERFGLAEMHSRSPRIAAALLAAVTAQLPIYLHLIVCAPVPMASTGPEPPRWEFLAVQKRLCFYFEPTVPANRSSGGGAPAPKDDPAAALERPSTPPSHFQPLQLQSLFQSVWMGDTDAAWYSGLKENRPDAPGGVGFNDARAQFMGFLRSQACKFLMRGDHLNLLETCLLLVPEVGRDEREALLGEMREIFNSDASVLADLAHQSHVIQKALLAAEGPATPAPKRAFAIGVAQRQCAHVTSAVVDFCARARWADLEPVKPILMSATRMLTDEESGVLRVGAAAHRNLRRLRRACHAVHQSLADTLISSKPAIKAFVTRLWEESGDVEVPVSLQPPSMRVKVVDVHAERERQRKTKTYPAAVAREAVLVQYVVDTGLERELTAALTTYCSARTLKGNPITSILRRVKAAAQSFELWRESDERVSAQMLQDVSLSDLRRGVYLSTANGGGGRSGRGASSNPKFHSARSRWGDLSTQAQLHDDDGRHGVGGAGGGGGSGVDTLFGVKPSILLAERAQLHELRTQLAELMPMRSITVAQKYECTVNTCFCGEMLLQGHGTSLDGLHAVEAREDHFVHGPNEHEALSIHCQHVIQSFLRLHHKTLHIADRIAIGDHLSWGIHEVLQGQREVFNGVIGGLRRGETLCTRVYALVRSHGEPRYLSITKGHHLCHFRPPQQPAGYLPSAQPKRPEPKAYPARTTQLFDSIFFSAAHVRLCLEAEATTLDPLVSWRAKKWERSLTERAHEAIREGKVVPACHALLQRALLRGETEPDAASPVPSILPGAGRLMRSAAAKLHRLSKLSATLQGVLRSADTEENKLKLDQRALGRMFHAYRVPTLESLASDTSCNFEALRCTVQEGFYAVILDLRTQGVLTRDARNVLETVHDYMELVEAALATQLVQCDVHLRRELDELDHPPSQVMRLSASEVATAGKVMMALR